MSFTASSPQPRNGIDSLEKLISQSQDQLVLPFGKQLKGQKPRYNGFLAAGIVTLDCPFCSIERLI